ncbi:hypothetical protein DFH07DRAFT_961559 [Mycena maculata]|uniref:F-box domain-containing protein n=1 Tax=Mycena maculata TaxID=230809 RepID=A0AAD7N9C2_9AGAR|nr:hypothetical protein DFH07DRAFT_961559 [Mycena maculata]
MSNANELFLLPELTAALGDPVKCQRLLFSTTLREIAPAMVKHVFGHSVEIPRIGPLYEGNGDTGGAFERGYARFDLEAADSHGRFVLDEENTTRLQTSLRTTLLLYAPQAFEYPDSTIPFSRKSDTHRLGVSYLSEDEDDPREYPNPDGVEIVIVVRPTLRLSEIDAQLGQTADEATRLVELNRLRERLPEENENIQESLDLIIYPILSLPAEITMEIFRRCLPDEPTEPSASIAPMLLTEICQEWRHIALADHRLWSSLRIGTPFDEIPKHLLPLMKEWLGRAKNMLSSLHIVLPYPNCRFIDSFFCSSFGDEESEEYSYGVAASLLADSWGDLTSFRGDFFTIEECMELLRRASRLVRCEFHRINCIYDSVPLSVAPLPLPNIQYLTITAPEQNDDTRCLQALFNLLILPELRSLDVLCTPPCFTDVSSSFLLFLRSTPSISHFTARLELEDGGYTVTGEPMVDAVVVPTFSAMPSLVTLALHVEREHTVFVFLDALKASETFLPRIQRVAFYVNTSPQDWYYDELRYIVDALALRSNQLLDFGITFSYAAELKPFSTENKGDDETRKQLLRFQELKKNGMRIHIGPPEDSWV